MTKRQVFESVQDVIAQMFLISPQTIRPDTDLQHNFALDSLDTMEIFIKVGNRLKCKITSEDETLLKESFAANPTPKTITNFFCDKLNVLQPNTKILYQKSVPELVAIIEWQREELARLRAQNTK